MIHRTLTALSGQTIEIKLVNTGYCSLFEIDLYSLYFNQVDRNLTGVMLNCPYEQFTRTKDELIKMVNTQSYTGISKEFFNSIN